MDNSRRVFSDELKQEIIAQVESGKLTKEQARQKYQIKGKSAILYWLRKYAKSNTTFTQKSNSTMAAQDKNTHELLLKIKKLERSLEDAELTAEGYSRMIDIAERELKISIRKKYNTKQSKK
jgi:transposase-like protein